MDYTIIKEAILKILEIEGPKRNIMIRIKLGDMGHEVSSNRQFDKIIQKMRSDGLLIYRGNKWHPNNVKKCERCDGKGFVPINDSNVAA